LFFKKTTILHYHGKNRLPNLLAKLYLKVYDRVLCVSQDVADSLPPSKNKTVVYNGIDFLQYENVDASVAASEAAAITGPEGKHAANFLYAGLLRPHKGLHHLVPAFARLVKDNKSGKKPILFICGAAKLPAELAYRDSLMAYCKAQGVEQNIFWLGWKNNVLAWMKFADYLVFPTIDKELNTYEGFGKVIESSEGLPTVLIESSICDLYSIAANVTGVKEIITEGINGSIYENENAEGLYNALSSVMHNRPVISGFPGSNNFSLTVFEEKMLSVFTE
jgi:glycosyltransferase involved in cell wall biosynthesis